MSTLTTPTLPKPTEALPNLGYTNGTPVVIEATWSTMEPEEGGCYTAHVLTVSPDNEDGRIFTVLHLMCDINSDQWEVADAKVYDSILTAAERYTDLTGGR